MPISVEIGEHSACRVLVRAVHSRPGSDILESKSAQIPVKGIGTFQATEIEVAQAVAVDITGGDSRAVLEDPIARDCLFSEMICERESGHARSQRRESSLTHVGQRNRVAPIGPVIGPSL
jgi:hypothetical protein